MANKVQMKSQAEADRIAGRAYGVMFFAGFGSLWLLIGLAALHQLNYVTGALIAAFGLALLLPAICLHRRAEKHQPAAQDQAEAQQVRRAFLRINGAQYVAIPLVILAMNLLHRPEWIAASIAVVVGLNLLPLATLFHSPAHRITGTALIAYAVFTMAVLPLAEAPSLGALGSGAILLVSATHSLRSSRAAFAAHLRMQLA